jgi:urea transport system ATP-binding protein
VAATCSSMKSHKIVRLGVGRTFQTATVFEELTVLQNLDIAAGIHRKALGLLLARRKVPERVEEALETIGLTELVATDRPGSWPTGRSSGSRSACCWCRTPR